MKGHLCGWKVQNIFYFMVFISFTLYNEKYLLMWPKLSNAIFSKLVFIVSRAYPSDREKRDENLFKQNEFFMYIAVGHKVGIFS